MNVYLTIKGYSYQGEDASTAKVFSSFEKAHEFVKEQTEKTKSYSDVYWTVYEKEVL